MAAAFGLGFSGIIPAYVLAVRELFPASEASWRIPTLLLFSGSGMAAGGWLAGLLYDHFGYYAPAFAAGIGANILNLLVVGVLVVRQRYRAAMPDRHTGRNIFQVYVPYIPSMRNIPTCDPDITPLQMNQILALAG